MIHAASTMQHIQKRRQSTLSSPVRERDRAIAQTQTGKFAMKRSQQALHFIRLIFYKFGAFAHRELGISSTYTMQQITGKKQNIITRAWWW